MVSIIILTMGEDDILKKCISSIQTHIKCTYEIILLNNTDHPIESLKSSPITIIENKKNLGFARAVNKGIQASSGDMILLLNSDTRFTSDIITPMETFLATHPKAGICGPQLIFPDNRLQNSIDIIPNILTIFMNKAILKILFPGKYPSKRSGFKGPVQVATIIGACMLIKKELIDAAGMLDEGFFFYLEETDFCKRAHDHGYEVWHLPQLQIVHYQGESARKSDIARKIEFHRSMYRFFLKHKGPQQTLVLYLFMIIKSLFEMITNIPFAFIPKVKDRLKRSGALFIWHIMGLPEGWGMEKTRPIYQKVWSHGYTWFLPQGASLPSETKDPRAFMEGFSVNILNRSRTTFVKSGIVGGKTIYFKRYNFKGIRDTLKNIFRKSRALRAFEGALIIENQGVCTPSVWFACEKRICGILLESYIATHGIDGMDLVSHVHKQGYTDTDIIRLSRYIRRLHEMGILPVDLKGENVLINDTSLYLIDLDRLNKVRFLTLRMRAKNLSYLNASFESLIPHEKRLLFLDEYIKGNTSLEIRRQVFIETIKTLTDKRLRTRYT